MVVLILLAVSATVASAGCGPDIGFNADLRLNNNVNKAAIWTEVKNWRTQGSPALYNTGNLFNEKTGRFTTNIDGYFVCSTQIRLDGASTKGNFRLLIGINGAGRTNNGLSVIAGNGGSTNYRTLSVSGTMQLKKKQYASVFVYSSDDPQYKVQSESGFSCHRFYSSIGFLVHKKGKQMNGKGWSKIGGWHVDDPTETEGLYAVGGGFDPSSGLYTAPQKGVYYCFANIRLDDTDAGGYYRLVLAVNGKNDINNGLHAISGNGGSTNFRSIVVSGSVLLQKGNTVSADVFSSSSKQYKVQSNSGFGCHFMKQNIGFHANAKTTEQFGKGWSLVSKWEDRTSVNPGLYALGGSIATNGYYHAPATGYYQCSAQVRIDAASHGSYFRLILAINGDRSTNQGLHAIEGNKVSTNYGTMRVAGALRLQKGSTVSVWVFASNDNSYRVQSESGFSCQMFAPTKCPVRACHVENGGFEKDRKPLYGPQHQPGYQYMVPTGWQGKDTVLIRTRNGPWGGLPSFAGRYFAGIQRKGSYLQTTIHGLVPGELYAIKFAAANRPGYGEAEQFKILINGKTVLATTHPGKSWEQHQLHFVATSDHAILRFENTSPKGGDSTVFIDQVEGVGTHVCDNPKWTTEGDRCYRFYPQDGLDYPQMQAKCVQAGGELARIDNAKQDALVHRLAGKSRAFIGATDAAVEGKWMWADGTRVTYTNWNPGEPNNYQPIGGEDCAEVNWGANGKWNDIQCKSNSLSEGYVCSAVVSAESIAAQKPHGPVTGKCSAGYNFCAKKKCCDINNDCTCDQICNHADKYFRADVGCSYQLATVVKRQCAESGFAAKKGATVTIGKNWHEITNWKASGLHGVYNAGNHFNVKNGRFYSVKDGYFLCAAQIRLDNAANTAYFSALINVNGAKALTNYNGMQVVDGNGGSTDYRTLSITGTIQLKRGSFVSAFVYSNADNSYKVVGTSSFSCHHLAVPIGFHSVKYGKQRIRKTGWQMITRWRTSGTRGLYAVGINTNYLNKLNRFYAPRGGAYFCSAQLRLDSASSDSYMRLLLALNGKVDPNDGLAAIRGSTGTAMPPVKTHKWTESEGVNCVSSATLAIGKQNKVYDNNVDLKHCQTTCENSKTCAGFNYGFRRCYYFSKLSRESGMMDHYHECWTITRSQPPKTRNINYGTMTVAGTVYLNPRQNIAVYVYSSKDSSYDVEGESGWGCHFMNSRVGFHANAAGNQHFGKGWSRVSKWQDSPLKNHALYSIGGGVASNGYYHAGATGYYVCNVQVRLDSAEKQSFFQLRLALNGDRSANSGFNAMEGNGGAQNYRTLRVAGTMHLHKGETVSVWLYSQRDTSYTMQAQSGFSCQMFGRAKCSVPAKKTTAAATTPLKPCAVPNGANADLVQNIAAHAGWKEIKNWRSSGNAYLYNSGGSLDGQKGRFVARTDGYYFCSAQARLDGAAATSYFRMLIAINHHVDTNNGLHVIDGNGGATNFRTMSVAGTIVLKKGDYASVWVYSSGDAYTIQSETGFSCHRFTTTVGFHADKTNNQNVNQKGWQELTRWRTSGPAGLYNVDGFNIDTGLFTTPKTAAYFCFAQVRLDGASSTKGVYFRLLLAVNRRKDTYNGLSDIQGNGASSNVRSMSVAGTVYLVSGTALSLNVFSSKDASYRIQTESGWGCHQLKTRVGFHAHVKTDNRFGRGWNTVKGWVARNRGKGDEELYSWGGGISGDGFYEVRRTGYYVCAVKLRIDSADSNSFFRAIVSLNGNLYTNGGALHAIDGWSGSTDFRTLNMAGTLQLKKGQTVSVHVYSQKDVYVRVQRESGFSCHMFGVPTCKDHSTDIATAMPAPCEPDTGVNADLAVPSINARRGWTEVRNWRTSGDRALYNAGGNMDIKTGRFTAHYNGYYLCSTQLRLDGAAATSFFRATIAINGNRNGNNGLHVIAGNGGSTNYRTLSITGTIQLKAGQHTSVFVFSSGDAYKIQSESGFSCHRFSTEIGFHADKTGDLVEKKVGWQAITRWRVSGQSGLYSVGGGFNLDTGRFTAPKHAVYYCYAQVRVDGASTDKGSYFRLLLALNNRKDTRNGFESVGGNHESSNYRSMGVAGTIYMQSGDYMAVNVYSSKDPSYKVQTESGWGCHHMNSRHGFHADGKENQRLGRGWTSLKTWNVNPRIKGGDKQLYSMGGGISGDGFYQVRADGYYVCAVNARLDGASPDGYFRLILAINGNTDLNQGLHAISGNGGSSNVRTMKIAGTLPLKKGQTLSVYLFSSGDQNYYLQQESGFSCQMFGVCKDLKKPESTTPAHVATALAGKRCGTPLCKGSKCVGCTAGLRCMTYNTAAQFGTCTPMSCGACVKAKAYWLNGECRFGNTGNKRAVRTMKDCSKQYAAKHANCPQYQNCRKCITASKSLCGWAGGAFGSCGAYNADSVFGKVNLNAKKCGGDAVVVHG